MQAVATAGNILAGQSLTQIIQGAKAPAKMAKVIQDYPEVGAILDAYQKGEYHNLTLSQGALQALADATGVSTEVLLTSITAHQGIQGATNKELTVIDTHDELRQDSIQTLAHELDHVRGGKNETLADLAGLAAKLNTDAAIIANQDTINPIKAQLGDGTDTLTTAQNQALLNQNNQTFIENHEGKEGEWSYDHWGCIGNNCGDAGERGVRNSFLISNQEALIIKDALSIALPALDSLELANKYKNAKTDSEKQAILASALSIPVNKTGKILKAVKSGNKADVAKEMTAAQKRHEAYLKHSAKWSSGSFKDAYNRLTPGAKGVVSNDRVKTRYTSSDGRYIIIKDNENSYYRIYDNNRNQYLDNNGNVVSTGSRRGNDAKDYVQQQTHIKDTDGD